MARQLKKRHSDDWVRNTKNIWFPDQVEPDPNEDYDKFIQYWKRERSRCTNGFRLGNDQVYISGWLYFHTVYWTIELDVKYINPITGVETSNKAPGIATLRDIEWIVSQDLQRVEIEKGIYNLVSCRGIGKSFLAGSFIGQSYFFFDSSENLLTGGNTPDINKLGEKVALGVDNIHPVFQKHRIKNNWKVEVRAGYEDKATGAVKGSNSRILTRNYKDGINSMATNGTRPKRQIIDEQGKIKYLKDCLLNSKPSWMNDFGFFSTVFLTGTGGDMEVGEEAGIVFNNPELYGCLQFDDIWEGQGKIGRFIPTTLGRNEFKEPWTLYDFLKNKYPEEYGNLQPHEELTRVTIMVSNEERCMKEFVIPRRELAMKSTSSNEIISEKAYYPIVPSECFLKLSANDFPIEAAQEHLNHLRKIGFKPVRIELYQDSNGVIRSKFTDKLPVTDFPVNKSSNKEGVIEILEYPIAGSPWGTYVAGMDPYKVSESDYSDSLGAVYIFKRMTTNMTEPYQHMPVAWYVGRPKNIRDWQENARMLLEFYNAECMCEANDESFIQYMMILNKQNYLARGQASLKEITQDSKFKGLYGLPATTKTIEKWNNSLVIYTKEMLAKLDSEEGEPRVEMGINKILDVMLLEEIIKFNKHSGNFDRVRAMGIALAYANQLDAWLGKTTIEEEYREKTKIIRSPFALNNISNRQNSKYSRKVHSPFLINKER